MPVILLGNKLDWREALRRHFGPPSLVQKERRFFWGKKQRCQETEKRKQAITRIEVAFSELALDSYGVQSSAIDFILPFLISEYELLTEFPEVQRKYLCPNIGLAAELDDKQRFNALLVDLGFSDCLPRVGDPRDLRFPVIRKKRIDEYGMNSRVISDADELVLEESCNDFYFQEYVHGRDEYATHAICVRGSVIFSNTYKYLFDTDGHVKSKNSKPRSTLKMGGFMPIELSEILSEIEYTGCGCFNYKLRDGVPMIFELNPRVGASFAYDPDEYLAAYMRAVELNNRRSSGASKKVIQPQ